MKSSVAGSLNCRPIRPAWKSLACSPRQPGASLRFLLTSSGISNTSIHDALVDLLGKPIAESGALCIPTGVQPFAGGPSHVYRFISGSTQSPMCGLGWKSLGVLELTAAQREDMPDTSLADVERWAAQMRMPAYAIDDQTAIKVVDGTVEVVSEGHWKLFTP
jgi:hypothetical protein